MSQPRFLVVDDATFTRDLIKKTLRHHFPGCPIDDAASARKAMATAVLNPPDLILSDWEMPEMTGEEFLLWVRGQDTLAKTPFIMVTSRGERDYVVKAVNAGVNDYISKPFTAEDIVSKVTKQLKRIGKMPTRQSAGATQGVAFSSVEALTMRRSGSDHPGSTAEASGAETPAAPRSATPKTGAAKGQAVLHFAGGRNEQCLVLAVTLQQITGIIRRSERLPVVFEQGVVSIVQRDGEDVARLNAYVHSMEAADSRIDSEFVRLVLRFTDDDPQKLEHLSRYIATL